MDGTYLVSMRKILGRLKRKMFRTNGAIWFCCDLGSCPLPESDENVSMEFDDLDSAIGFLRENVGKFPWIFVQKEVDAALQYRHCYPVISYCGEKAGYIKIALGRAYVEDFDEILLLREDEAFVCDTFIDPQFRGKGLSRTLLGETIGWLRKKQIRYLFCHIPSWNEASLNLYRGYGFKKIHKVRHVRLFGLRYYTRTPRDIFSEGRKLFLNQ